ncbi:hypothetical protein HOP50_04g34760 [Chloropicon primus]|uniref:Uncharacterized protein n=1 Tax=Chloropicon primus TaxID=1764295 RepID=A0A5B8MNM9_9CHLO|nr:hypothetical protein A3770_04p34700 [Chloropicon primus]UPR00162.1 hypothetical protein HOP50_04g34760 [Chloropicon primus]|eukprot:QDZ20952.1 hypothetical protein A3770_04p34700 [Chloropicon primus]
MRRDRVVGQVGRVLLFVVAFVVVVVVVGGAGADSEAQSGRAEGSGGRKLLLAGVNIGGWIVPQGIPPAVKLTVSHGRPSEEDRDLSKTEPGSLARYEQVLAIREGDRGPTVTYPFQEYLDCKGPCETRLRMKEQAMEEEDERFGGVFGDVMLPPTARRNHLPIHG